MAAGADGGDGGGAAKDQPYYWTMSVRGETFRGTGPDADAALAFDDGTVTVFLNGRKLSAVAYEADPNADGDERIISLPGGVYLGDGVADALRYADGWRGDSVLRCDLALPDGTRREAVFHIRSDEELFIDAGEDGMPFLTLE